MFKKLCLAVLVLACSFSSFALAADTIEIENKVTWSGGDMGLKRPIDKEVQYGGKDSRRYEVQNEGTWFVAQAEFEKIDLSAYKDNGVLEFAFRGENGGEKVRIALRSGHNSLGNEKKGKVEIEATKDWKVVQIPIKDFIASEAAWDYKGFNAFEMNQSDSYLKPLKVWVADVRIKNVEAKASADSKAATDSKPAANPKTGDSGMTPFVILLAASGGILLTVALRRKAYSR